MGSLEEKERARLMAADPFDPSSQDLGRLWFTSDLLARSMVTDILEVQDQRTQRDARVELRDRVMLFNYHVGEAIKMLNDPLLANLLRAVRESIVRAAQQEEADEEAHGSQTKRAD